MRQRIPQLQNPQTSDEENKPEEDFEMEDADDFEEEFYQDEWDLDEEYAPKQKPSLDDDTKAALMIRKTQRATMPKFRRQEWFRYYRLARTGWRKPNGYQSKQRLNMKYRTPMVRIGHRKIASVRGLHPSGFEEVLVKTPSDLEDSILTHRLLGSVRASVIERGPLYTTELIN